MGNFVYYMVTNTLHELPGMIFGLILAFGLILIFTIVATGVNILLAALEGKSVGSASTEELEAELEYRRNGNANE